MCGKQILSEVSKTLTRLLEKNRAEASAIATAHPTGNRIVN